MSEIKEGGVPSLPEELRKRMLAEVGGKNHARQQVTMALRLTNLTPQEQLGVAVVVTAVAARKVFDELEAAGKSLNRGQRHKIIRTMAEEFETKVKELSQTRPRDDDPPHDGIPRQADGRVDLDAANAANNPDVNHGGREEDDQDNEEGA